MLKKARMGKSIDEDEIPPAVAITTKRPQPPPPTGIHIHVFGSCY